MKPTWDEYFIDMAFFVATRSIDQSTKCGCVIVSSNHGVLSTGYNSPPRDCIDDMIPMTRPEKYPYMVHSEENAILNAARHGICLDGSTFYVTGTPCSRCLRMIINVGAKNVIHGPNEAVMHDDAEKLVIERINLSAYKNGQAIEPPTKVEITKFSGKIGSVIECARQNMEKKFGSCIIDTEGAR